MWSQQKKTKTREKRAEKSLKGVIRGNQSSFRTLHRCNNIKCIVLNQFISILLKTWFALQPLLEKEGNETCFHVIQSIFNGLVAFHWEEYKYESGFEDGKCYVTNILLILWLEELKTFWKIICWDFKLANFRRNLNCSIHIQVLFVASSLFFFLFSHRIKSFVIWRGS